MTLSSKKIAAMKPRDKRYSVADGNGLTLRVMPSGRKIWYFRTSCSGRVADKRLGEHPDMSLMQARQKARRLRKDIGLEPPKGYVLKDAFRLWCRLKKPQIVSYQDERRRLERYIIEPLGNRQLDEITAPLVIRTVQPIEKDGKQATLKRDLQQLFDRAACRRPVVFLHQDLMQKSERTDDGWTADDLPQTALDLEASMLKVVGTFCLPSCPW